MGHILGCQMFWLGKFFTESYPVGFTCLRKFHTWQVKIPIVLVGEEAELDIKPFADAFQNRAQGTGPLLWENFSQQLILYCQK
jgi:hypothetical protein